MFVRVFRVAGGGGALLPPPTQLFWTLSKWTHVSSHKTTLYELEYLKGLTHQSLATWLCGNVQKTALYYKLNTLKKCLKFSSTYARQV
jgi:hypothetical protein